MEDYNKNERYLKDTKNGNSIYYDGLTDQLAHKHMMDLVGENKGWYFR